jgi:hypothetical protein
VTSYETQEYTYFRHRRALVNININMWLGHCKVSIANSSVVLQVPGGILVRIESRMTGPQV